MDSKRSHPKQGPASLALHVCAAALFLLSWNTLTPTPALAEGGEVIVERMTPWHGSPWPDGSTSPTPSFFAVLLDGLGQGVDEIEILLDGEYWATWLDGIGPADWVRGGGEATTRYDDGDPTRILLEYSHSPFRRDWLPEGEHELEIRFRPASGEWVELSPEAPFARFRVAYAAASIR